MSELQNLFGNTEISRTDELLTQMKNGVQTVRYDMSGILFRVKGVADLKHDTERQEMGKLGALYIVEVLEKHQPESTD